MTIFGRKIDVWPPFGRKKTMKNTITIHKPTVSIILLSLTEFLLITIMATVVLNLAKAHQIKGNFSSDISIKEINRL